MWFKRLSILATIVTVAGCQSLPQPAEKKIPEKPTQADKEQKTPSGVTIHPYDREEIQRQKIVIPEQKSKQQFDDGRQLPAFKSLMQKNANGLSPRPVEPSTKLRHASTAFSTTVE
jgi:hypothetical protein